MKTYQSEYLHSAGNGQGEFSKECFLTILRADGHGAGGEAGLLTSLHSLFAPQNELRLDMF